MFNMWYCLKSKALLEVDIKTTALVTIQADSGRKKWRGHEMSVLVKNLNFNKLWNFNEFFCAIFSHVLVSC